MSRSRFEDVSGRAIENSEAMAASSPGIPEPSSSTKKPDSPNLPTPQLPAASSALSTSSLARSLGISLTATPAICPTPSIVRSRAQSGSSKSF